MIRRTNAMEARLRGIVAAGPAAIDERIAKLEREWTAGRAAQAAGGVLILLGLGLGLGLHEFWWFVLPIGVAATLAPLAFGKRSLLGDLFGLAGLRHGAEVEHEKLALRVLRGDFQHLTTVHQLADSDSMARMEGEGGIVYEPQAEAIDATAAVKEIIGAARQ